MALLVSPGVNTSEIDLTSSVPAVGVSSGATAGFFRWGPANTVVQVSSESDLLERFFKPDNSTAGSFLSAANFLGYGNELNLVRVIRETSGASDSTYNAVSGSDANRANVSITLTLNSVEVNLTSTLVEANTSSLGSASAGFTQLFPGDYVTCNSEIRVVSAITSANAFTVTAAFTNNGTDKAISTAVKRPGKVVVPNDIDYSTNEYLTASSELYWAARFPGKLGNSLKVSVCATTAAYSAWPYAIFFDSAPGTSSYAAASGLATANDEMHIVVVDEDGQFSGTANTVLERFAYVSKASDAKTNDGTANYYKEAIYRTSKYVHWLGHPDNANAVSANAWGQAVSTLVDAATASYHSPAAVVTNSLINGTDGTPHTDDYENAFDLFENKETYDVSLLFAGDCGYSANAAIDVGQVANTVLLIADTRKDCVAFVSPTYASAVTSTAKVTDVVAARNSRRSTSYGVMDSGWKYQYDKYNDVYRWVPLNADIAGLCVRTDATRDPWFSPAGVNRGQIRNIVKLSYNPTPGERDTLYKNGVNPVVAFPGEGTILYGDKTMQGRSSAFDRINVRRLFIVLEKAISKASRASLFEFNDEFTRSQFVALIEPFLKDVQGRRGIYDFRVVCDETNNPASVIDRNEFVGDIYVKPARSINFIQLNFVAVRSGVAFDEIVGRF